MKLMSVEYLYEEEGDSIFEVEFNNYLSAFDPRSWLIFRVKLNGNLPDPCTLEMDQEGSLCCPRLDTPAHKVALFYAKKETKYSGLLHNKIKEIMESRNANNI